MKRRFQLLMMAAGLTFFVACGGNPNNTEAAAADVLTENTSDQENWGQESDDELREKIIGTWDCQKEYIPQQEWYEFRPDGTYTAAFTNEEGTGTVTKTGSWEVSMGSLLIEDEDLDLYFLNDYMLLEQIVITGNPDDPQTAEAYFMKEGYKKRK